MDRKIVLVFVSMLLFSVAGSALLSSEAFSSTYSRSSGLSEALATKWSKTFGGAKVDRATSFQQTDDGGYIIGGTTNSFGAGGIDVWLVKIDSAGNMQWNKTYGDISDDEELGSVRQTSEGGYIFTGAFSTVVNGIAISKGWWLVKTDSLGNQQWNKSRVGGVMEQTSDGGCITAGVKLVKFDASGNVQWNKTYGGEGWGWPLSIQQTIDGGYILAWTTHNGQSDAWLVKMDSTANMLWNKTYGGASYDSVGSVRQTTDGGYIVVGSTMSFGAGDWDFWLVKTDASGNQQWAKTFGGTESDGADSVQQTNDGGYIVAGSTDSFGAESGDAWLVKTDSTGNKQWSKTLGGTDEDSAGFVQQTSDGGYIVAGNTLSFGAGESDFWIIKLASEAPPPPEVEPSPINVVPYAVAGIVATILIVGILIYFIKIRKP